MLTLTDDQIPDIKLSDEDNMKVELQIKKLKVSQRWIRKGSENSFTLQSFEDKKYLALENGKLMLKNTGEYIF